MILQFVFCEMWVEEMWVVFREVRKKTYSKKVQKRSLPAYTAFQQLYTCLVWGKQRPKAKQNIVLLPKNLNHAQTQKNSSESSV